MLLFLPMLALDMLMFLPMLALDMPVFELVEEFDELIFELIPVFEPVVVVVVVVLVFVLVVVFAFSPPPQPVQKAATARRAKRAKVLRIEFFSCNPKGQWLGTARSAWRGLAPSNYPRISSVKVKPLTRSPGPVNSRQRVCTRRHVKFANDCARRLIA